MKHRNLLPVDTRNAALPGYCDRLQVWIDRLPSLFNNPSVPVPKAILLCGIAGVGKGTAAKVIARTLNRPLFLLDGSIPLTDLDLLTDDREPLALWVENPTEQHVGLIRWIQDAEPINVFVILTTDRPQQVPACFTRADLIESIWHLDLPTLKDRNALWGDLLSTRITGHHTHDSVKLGQLSAMFSPAEIRAAFGMAMRDCGGVPKPGKLIDVVIGLKPIALRMDAELSRLRAWAQEHASAASSCGRGAEP